MPNFVEPFAGSLAVLLARPGEPGIETVNDACGFICNAWRAMRSAPDETAYWADMPVMENQLHAIHSLLKGNRNELTARLEGDVDYFDARVAGYWLYGISCWIGHGWCQADGPWIVEDGQLIDSRQMPHLGDAGQGVNRKMPHLGDAGQGVNRKRPNLSSGFGQAFKGINDRARKTEGGLICYMQSIADRIKDVRVCCGDWSRICGPSVTEKLGLTGVFLDPPYSHDVRDKALYGVETDCSEAVREWAIAHGDNPLYRIALCGYDGEHKMPSSWEEVAWKAAGGYENQGKESKTGNCKKERIWFSKHCNRGGFDFGLEETT